MARALARRIADRPERPPKDGSFERKFEIFRAPFSEKQIGFRNRKTSFA